MGIKEELENLLQIYVRCPKTKELKQSIDFTIDTFVWMLSYDGKINPSFVDELSDFIKGTVRIL